MEYLPHIVAGLTAAAAYYFGVKNGFKQGAMTAAHQFQHAVVQYAFRNPGITDARINELADSLIKSDGDMHEQAVNHIRQAAQEAVGIAEKA